MQGVCVPTCGSGWRAQLSSAGSRSAICLRQVRSGGGGGTIGWGPAALTGGWVTTSARSEWLRPFYWKALANEDKQLLGRTSSLQLPLLEPHSRDTLCTKALNRLRLIMNSVWSRRLCSCCLSANYRETSWFSWRSEVMCSLLDTGGFHDESCVAGSARLRLPWLVHVCV